MTWVTQLPLVNALLNTTSAILLLLGYVFIKRGNILAHRRAMIAALTTSALFLTSYLIYHYHVGSVKFQGQGWSRPVYFFILITHVILAAGIVPLVLMTVTRALKGQYARHKNVARRTLPLWAYVSVTGVIVYLMVYQLFPAAP